MAGRGSVNPDQGGAHGELRRSFTLRVVAAAAGMVATFLLTVIVVRTLDSRDTAAFFAFLAALSIGPMIGRLGLGPNLIRLIPSESDEAKKREIAGTHLLATVLMSFPTAPFVAFATTASLIGHGDFVPTLVLTSVIITLETARLMLSDIFAAVGRVTASVATMHYIRSTLVLPVVGLAAFLVERPTLVTVLSTYAVAAAVQLAVALAGARKNIAFARITDIAELRTVVGASTRLFSLELSSFLMMSGTIWLANAVFIPLTATHYATAATIAMQVTLLESLAALAVTPPAARLWGQGKRDEVVRLLSNLCTVNVMITSILVLALAAFGRAILGFAYGPDMGDTNVLLVILALSGIIQAALGTSLSLLIIGGHITELARVAVGVLLVFLPLAVAAAVAGGPIALAATSSLGLSALYVGEYVVARKVLPAAPRPHRHLIRAARDLIDDSTRSSTD